MNLIINNLSRNRLLKTLAVIIIIILFPVDLILLYNLSYHQKIYPNVYINNQLLSGKNREEAKNYLQASIKNRQTSLNLVTSDFHTNLSELDVDFSYDLETSIKAAFAIGRQGNLINNTKKSLPLLRNPQRLNLAFSYNEVKLNTYLASVSAQLDQPIIPPTITLEQKSDNKIASVSAGLAGRKLNLMDTKILIKQAWAAQVYQPIYLPINKINKPINPGQLNKIKKLANNLISKKLIINYEDNDWELTDEEMINVLSVYDTFDNTKIASWSAQLANAVNRPSQNALFEFDGNKVTEFKPALPGIELNQLKTNIALKNEIKKLAINSQKEQTITLKVIKTLPEINTETVNDLGIKELIGKGESWFPHSIPGRIHNIDLSSSKFHGILVEPGQEFSFAKVVGEIDAAHGYQSAYIIKEGKTVLGDGGGVCQTSTTLFRAILDAGLEITKRHSHAYRVSYYEENSEPGIDATVFVPSVDLRFINDTADHILIQRNIDMDNTYLSFELYGTSDGRLVTRNEVKIWDQLPPPPPRYQDDPSLPSGVVKQVDWAAWGTKTAFDWKVTKDGEVLHEKTFYSNYRPWQAVFLRGTGG